MALLGLAGLAARRRR
ncbi:MAG: hypothetical protein KF705_04245 [Phycisphaeraceae bacterium]|nr:hypothetical protein [Phycisphaeraceae bacterium]